MLVTAHTVALMCERHARTRLDCQCVCAPQRVGSAAAYERACNAQPSLCHNSATMAVLSDCEQIFDLVYIDDLHEYYHVKEELR